MEEKYIAAIEIGSSHIRAAVGTVDDTGALTLLAVEEEHAVDVVRYGIVQNVDEVSNRIKRLILRLENYPSISPRKIKGVYIGIGGRSTASTSREVIRQFDEETDITAHIVDQIKEEAKANGLTERTVIDVLPKDFIVDNLECPNPVGTLGKSIRADINLITCRPKILRNLDIAITERQQLAIKDRFVRQISIADLVLTNDEKKLGCMLVDFGAETTTVSIYRGGSLRYLATLPLGSRNITRDVMMLNNITEERAEELKRALGDAMNEEPNFRKSDFDGDATKVNSGIRTRAGEIAVNILEQVKYAGYSLPNDIAGGIVVVGAGAKLKGFVDLLADQSKVKVRLGALPATIRISDSRLQNTGMIDIIALLNAAATHNPVECMEKPVSVNPTPDPFVDGEDDGPGIKPMKGGKKQKDRDDKPHEKGTSGIKGIFSRWASKWDSLLDDRESDEDDE